MVQSTSQQRQRQAVRDDYDSSPGMSPGSLCDSGLDPLQGLAQRFSARRPGAGQVSAEGGIFAGKLAADIFDQHAFPLAVIDLAQARVAKMRRGQSPREDFRRLHGPQQVAAIHGVYWFPLQAFRQRLRLGYALCIQRDIGVALDAPFEVPVRLPVADEEDFGHFQAPIMKGRGARRRAERRPRPFPR